MTEGSARRAGHAHHRRQGGHRPEGDADHPGRRAARHRDPAVLRPPAARPGGRLPAVLREGRGPAQADDVVLDAGRRRAWWCTRSSPTTRSHGRAGGEPRVPAAQPPARLPDLRPRRGVPAAGPGARVRARREPVRGGQADLPQAAAAVAAGEPGPRTLRAVRAVHPVLRPDLGRPVHRAVRPRRRPSRSSIAPGRGLPVSPFSGQHHPDLSGRRADGDDVPVRRAAVRPAGSGDSICPHCACGCNIRVDLRRGEVVRHLARDNDDVNEAWLCDKGRFAFAFPDRPSRLTTPLPARARASSRCRSPRRFAGDRPAWCRGRPASRFLAGGRLSDEDAYALSKLARTVFGTNDVDHRGRGRATSRSRSSARRRAGMPVTYARRRAGQGHPGGRPGRRAGAPDPAPSDPQGGPARGARCSCVHPRRTRLGDVAEHVLVPARARRPALLVGTPARPDGPAAGRVGAAGAGRAGVVLAGPRLAEQPGRRGRGGRGRAEAGARFALLCRRANDRGALQAGVHPALLPGGRRSADARTPGRGRGAWGPGLPAEPGRDASAILEAAADREIDVLFLVGVDPLRDIPDAAPRPPGAGERAAQGRGRTSPLGDASAIYADAMLPARRRRGEGRPLHGLGGPGAAAPAPCAPSRSACPEEWEIFQGLSEAMGRDMGFAIARGPAAEMRRAPRPAPTSAPGMPAVGPRRPPPAEPRRGRPMSLVLFSLPAAGRRGTV